MRKTEAFTVHSRDYFLAKCVSQFMEDLLIRKIVTRKKLP